MYVNPKLWEIFPTSSMYLGTFDYISNKLITDKQWAYRRGYSPELLIRGMEKGSVLVAAFVDF